MANKHAEKQTGKQTANEPVNKQPLSECSAQEHPLPKRLAQECAPQEHSAHKSPQENPTQDQRVIRALVNDLFTNTFNSVLRIEEFALKNRLTEGLSISELHTICAIGMYEQNPMNVVAARLDVTLATLTVAMNKLVKKGYVKRTRCEADRRRVLVELTTKGKKAYRVHGLFHKRIVNSALEGLSVNEEMVLIRALTKVKAFFEEEYEAMNAEYELLKKDTKVNA